MTIFSLGAVAIHNFHHNNHNQGVAGNHFIGHADSHDIIGHAANSGHNAVIRLAENGYSSIIHGIKNILFQHQDEKQELKPHAKRHTPAAIK